MYPRDVFFPQRCSYLSCAFSTNGELRVAMAAGNRLLFMKEGSLCACGPLFDAPHGGAARTSKCRTEKEEESDAVALRQIRFCHFTDDIRVAVVGANGVTIVDVVEHNMQPKYRHVLKDSYTANSVDGLVGSSSVPASGTRETTLFSSLNWLSKWNTSVSCKEAHEMVDAEFISVSSLAIVLSNEAMIVDFGGNNDVIKWRTWGSYSTLAVCRTNLHLAFALHTSAVEVFPLKVKSSKKPSFPESSLQDQSEPSILYSPTYDKSSFASKYPTKSEKFALRGVSARLGVYKVTGIEWHRIHSHTILSATCQDPDDGQFSIALFTVQSIPEIWISQEKSGEVSKTYTRQCNENDCSLQLIPAGIISLHSTSSFRAQLVPSFSRFRNTKSLGNKLEFLCFDEDGTVRTMSYRFSQQKQGDCPRQRTGGLKASQLLLPLEESYGKIVHLCVLPIWKSRAVEVGTFTPQAEQLLRARRYRLLLHFANGMVAKVMIDMLTLVVRVEAFLTLGVDALPLHLSTCQVDDGAMLLFGISRERVFVIQQAMRDDNVSDAKLLAVSPIPVEHSERLWKPQTSFVSTTHMDEVTAGDEKREGEETVKFFMEMKCPEKVRMIPALMRACGGDAGKLLTQLTAKYGPLESPYVSMKGSQNYTTATTTTTNNNNNNNDSDSKNDALCAQVGASSSSSSLSLSEGFSLQRVEMTAAGICCCTRISINSEEHWWCIPAATLESFAAAESELLLPAAQLPATAHIRFLNAPPPVGGKHLVLDHSEVSCEWVESTKRVIVHSTLLPDNPPLSFSPCESSVQYHVEQIKAITLGNKDVIIGVMVRMCNREPKSVLWLYGLDLLRDITVSPLFLMELEIFEVVSFFLTDSDELFVLRRHQKNIERWIRVVNENSNGSGTGGDGGSGRGHHWRESHVYKKMDENQGEITAMTSLWGKKKRICDNNNNNDNNMKLEQFLVSSFNGSFISTWNITSMHRKSSVRFNRDDELLSNNTTKEIYHPRTLLLLLTMGKWHVVRSILEHVLRLLLCAANTKSISDSDDIKPRVLARELCHNPVSIRLYEQPFLRTEDFHTAAFAADESLHHDVQIERLLEQDKKKNDDNSLLDTEFPLDMLNQIMEHLSVLQLHGLSNQEQLGLLCIVDAIRETKLFTSGMDLAASKYFFVLKLHQFWRRLSVLETLTDTLPCIHSAFLWAALSDAQPQLLDGLLSRYDGKDPLQWGDVEVCNMPIWLKSLQSLRVIAERLAREQYKATKDVRECALMYVLAGKVGVLAALCKAEQNAKLNAFFLRDFNDPKNKMAASSNAFAAVGKNMIAYGAAFFILAGEHRNAAQVLLQRHGSITLAFFVLRLAGNDDRDDSIWFIGQRRREEENYGPMNVWEEACLLWRCGHAEEARTLLSHHVPQSAVDAAEVLSFMRHERRRARVEGLTPMRELILLMQMARFSHASGMDLPAIMTCCEAEAVLAHVRGAKAEESRSMETRKTAAARTEADFNTGTLTFHGFDLDDDDDDEYRSIHLEKRDPADLQTTFTANMERMSIADDIEDVKLLDATLAVALEKELQWTQHRVYRKPPVDGLLANNTSSISNERGSGIHAVVVCTARMMADMGRRVPIAQMEDRLLCLMETLVTAQKSHVDDSTPPPVLLGVVTRLAIITVRLVLLSTAFRNTDYALVNGLLGFPTLEKVFHKENIEMATLDSVLSFLNEVRSILIRVREMTLEWPEQGETGEMEIISHSCQFPQSFRDDDALGRAEVHEEKLRTILLLWSAGFLHLCTLSEIRREVSRVREMLTGLSHPPQYAKFILWLLGCMLCRVTLAFNAAASQLMSYVVSVRELDDSLLTNSNGIFIEEEMELRRIAELLEDNLLADDTQDTELLSQLHTISLDLCVARAEFFWRLPHINSKISADTDKVVLLLRDATKSHAAAQLVYSQLSDGAVNTLRKMEAAWLRRVHTHASLRELMLEMALAGSLARIITTDRLVLHQSYHKVCSVDYDRSSCDSLVWGTEAGAEVDHGYREILAGDNEAAFLLEQPDRNIVTEAALVGLRGGAGGGTAAAAQVTGRSSGALPKRPSSSFACRAMVAAHPYMPFFLTRHSDGCVDLYSFASTECMATFLCHGSHVVTEIAYSPNGYVFAAGLADGSVIGWRFDLTASSRDPLFIHPLLPPGGVKVTFFFEKQQSLLLVTGFDYAKEQSGTAAETRRKKEGYHFRTSDHRERRVVGVILVVDLVLRGGSVVVRRELPFVPEFAVYLRDRDLVLCVAVDGRMLLFDVWRSHIYILGTAPPTSPQITISCIAISHYDDVLAMGTKDGHALLLLVETLIEAKTACVEEMTCDSTMHTYVTEESILHKASRLQLAPVLKKHSGVSCMVFSPSVLLAGLNDGKLVAAALVSNAIRQGSPLLPK